MMKYTFPTPSCQYGCPYFHRAGDAHSGTYYCMKVGKTGRRFRKGDPKTKPPQWCPRRLPSPVCRIYGLKAPFYEALERESREAFDVKHMKYYFPMWHRYQLRCETDLHMAARPFYEAVQEEPLEAILHTELTPGEIIEIDDGIKPYFFYCYDPYTVIPALIVGLNPEEVQLR